MYLNEEIVEKAKKKMKTGQKLSPVVQELLEKWVDE